jgi:hypothetical protein
MTTAAFPLLAPDRDLTVVQPRHPHVAKRSSGGGETRIRLSNVRVGARLKLSFSHVSTRDLETFVRHWRDARGTAREFVLTAVNLGSMGAAARTALLSTTWKYAAPPKCIDICGGPSRLLHSLEVELVSQPRRVAAYVDPFAPELSLPVMPITLAGGVVVARASVVGGLAGVAAWNVGGGDVNAQAWATGGSASVGVGELPGADIVAVASAAGASSPAVGTRATIQATASVAGGNPSFSGTPPGGNITAVAIVAGGAVGNSNRSLGGAAIVATSSVAGGAASVGSVNPTFANVKLLIPGDGSNNSTNILDLSSNGLTITRSGAPVISTAAFANGGASVRFNSATTDAISANSSTLGVASDDFWFEMRLKFLSNTLSGAGFFISYNHDSGSEFSDGSSIYIAENSGNLAFNINAKTTDNQGFQTGAVNVPITITSFNHFAAGRVGNELAVWLNGVLYQDQWPFTAETKAIGSRTIKSLGNIIHIGARRRSGGSYDNGIDVYMDDFRFARQTPPWGLANYTPSSGPHPTS